MAKQHREEVAEVMGRKRRRDAQAVDDVLSELRDLHLRLSSDLSAVSGAVETDEPAVAADILEADRADLQRFMDRAGQRLIEGSGLDQDNEPAPLPAQREPSRGWRRALPALPAVAILAGSAAAAAMVAPHIGQQSGSPQSASAARPQTVQASTVTGDAVPAGFEQLRHAIVGHASAREVLAAADRWHHQLEALIATAAHNPRQLQRVITLLRQERQLLATHHGRDLGQVLAAATRIERHLLRTAAPLISSLPIPTQSLSPAPASASASAHPAHHRPAHTASSPTPKTTSSTRKSQSAPTSPSAPTATPTSPNWTPTWWSTPKRSFFGASG